MNPSAQSLAKGLCEGRVKADDLVNVSLNTPHSAIDCLVTWCDEVSLEVSRPICALASRARIAAVAARTPDLGLRLGSSPLPLIFGGIFDMKRLITPSTLMAVLLVSQSPGRAQEDHLVSITLESISRSSTCRRLNRSG